MFTSDGDLGVALLLGIAIAVLVLRRWARPYLDEAIAIRNSQYNGEPYEPPGGAGRSGAGARGGRPARHRPLTLMLVSPLLPFVVLADPRDWLRDVISDCAEAGRTTPRVLIVASHLCSAPNRVAVVWSGRCRRLLRLLPL